MRLGLTESEEQACLLENPLSNGALLIDLSRIWLRAVGFKSSEDCHVRSLALRDGAAWKSPQTVSGARTAIVSAMHAFGSGLSDEPAAHRALQIDTCVVEAILQGNMQVVWGVVSVVMTSLTRAHNVSHSGMLRHPACKFA